MARGKLTAWNEDNQCRAPSSAAIWRYWQLVPPVKELIIRRLRWYQCLVSEPDANDQVIAVLFGAPRLAWNKEDLTVLTAEGYINETTAHPWARRFLDDLETIMATEEGHDLSQTWSRKRVDLFSDEESREAFLKIDMHSLRNPVLSNCWAPPDAAAMLDELNPPSDDEEAATVQCTIVVFGRRCACRFLTHRAMRTHQTTSTLPGHQLRCELRQACVANFCVSCHTVFSTQEGAAQHFEAAWLNGRCIRGAGRSFPTCRDHGLSDDLPIV